MDALTVLLTCAVALVLLVLVASCLLRANRLDRLHVRTDAARAALLAALERRAVVARAVAVTRSDDRLRGSAARAEAAPPAERESAENELSALLAALDRTALAPPLRAELTDAEQRVMLARRVHNDAVRDTLALRSRRLVRWLRLYGNAPVPAYFEIADPEVGEEAAAAPRPRPAGRVVLLDPAGRVLLFEGFDPARPQESFWFTPGGGVEVGEDGRSAAVRELAEETGLKLAAEDLVGPVWRRRAVFSFDGGNLASDEEFFVARAAGDQIDTSGFTHLEVGTVLRHRWWTRDELRRTGAVVYPRELGVLLGSLRADRWDGVTRVVS